MGWALRPYGWRRDHSCTRDSALDQDEVLLGIDADNGKVLDGNALVTHVTGHLDALEDARRIGALTDRTGVTLEVRTMRHRTAALTPALDATLEALTLGGTDDVDLLDISEISDGDDLADLVLLAVLDADLTKEADSSTPALAK